MLKQGFCWVLSAAAFLLCVLGVAAQSTATASIEVAVVKPHPAVVLHNNFSFAKNRFELEDQPLLKLMAFAYAVSPRQIVGGPGWLADDRWDMSGTTDLAGDATLPQEQEIIRQLLLTRFGLQFHREKRDLPSYALQVVKNQPRLSVASDPAAQPLEWTEGHDSVRTEHYRSSTMADFLVIKQLFMDRPLLDQTGLSGRYDFKLTYSDGGMAAEVDAPPMFTALKEQLGLRFEPVTAPVDVMVIDHIGRPTQN